jgi:hypothetical protein
VLLAVFPLAIIEQILLPRVHLFRNMYESKTQQHTTHK